VATPNGKAVSSADFFIPPSPYITTDVEVTGRMALGESKTVAIGTANKVGLILFDAEAGQRVSLKVSGVNLTGGTYNFVSVSIKKTDGATLVSSTLDANGGFIDTQLLAVAGTYTILVDPLDTSTGNVTLTLYDVPADVTGTITAGGSPVTVTTTSPGQNGQLSFSGSANDRVSLRVTGLNLAGGSYNYLNVSIKKPDGSALVSSNFGGNGFIEPQTLPVSGTYTILVDPWDTSIGSATLTLYAVPADVSGTITPDGSAITVTTTVAGQNGQLSFNGSANQRVSLRVSGVNLTGGSYNWASVSIKRPDGSTLVSSTVTGNAFFDTQVLPVAGTYTILVDPWDTSTGSVTLTLYDVPADATSTATVGGSAVTMTTTVPGQNAQLTFSGTAAQQITVTFTNNSMGTVTAKLLKPDSAQLSWTSSNSSSFNLALQTLPTTGTYTLIIDPSGATTGSLTVTITEPAADLALNKTATQSSTNWSAPADRAVDGNTDGNFGNGSVTHTQVESQPWWQVDLGSVQSIGNIDVWNRTDCCGDALTNFYVFVSDDPFASTDLSTTQNQTGVSSYHVSGQGGTPTTVNANRTGRYVRVQLVGQDRLSLAEVQVWPAP